MRFKRLRDDVVMAERRVEVRVLRAQANWRVLGTVWREAWTPSRILVAGVAGSLPVLAPGIPVARRKGQEWVPHAALALNGILAPAAFPARRRNR